MKIVIIAPLNSFHTQRWIRSISKNNIQVYVFDYRKINNQDFKSIENVEVITINNSLNINNSVLRFCYGLVLLLKSVRRINPDIIHAHYATSYGLLGALVKRNIFLLSFWGSDIFEFPRKSFYHKVLIKYNLHKANQILSTSNVMAKEIMKYTNKDIFVTPFGVDVEKFYKRKTKHKKEITIGIIKQLENIYGHKFLLEAFSILYNKYKNIKLMIVGNGSIENELKELSKKLKIDNNVNFVGKIHFDNISNYHNLIDIFVNI